jgi:hypothetical protein
MDLRSVESPILREQSHLSGLVALLEDGGGFLDCMGRLRGDATALCPGCGRTTCDGGVQLLF